MSACRHPCVLARRVKRRPQTLVLVEPGLVAAADTDQATSRAVLRDMARTLYPPHSPASVKWPEVAAVGVLMDETSSERVPPMRVLICGGRHYENGNAVHHELVRFNWRHAISVIIHGGVSGPGPAAEAWARPKRRGSGPIPTELGALRQEGRKTQKRFESMIAEKEMLEARRKSFQHRTRIAVANGNEQGRYAPPHDCMIHFDRPH
jgi:YspA, cpYpsA-related SLOG family